jgi:hypothetical protein
VVVAGLALGAALRAAQAAAVLVAGFQVPAGLDQ